MYAVGTPLKQACAELVLGPGEQPRQGGLAYPQYSSGVGDLPVVREAEQTAEIFDPHPAIIRNLH
jgi:hypothetical protein